MTEPTPEPRTAGRRGMLALLLGGTTAVLTLTPKPSEADTVESLDGGTP